MSSMPLTAMSFGSRTSPPVITNRSSSAPACVSWTRPVPAAMSAS